MSQTDRGHESAHKFLFGISFHFWRQDGPEAPLLPPVVLRSPFTLAGQPWQKSHLPCSAHDPTPGPHARNMMLRNGAPCDISIGHALWACLTALIRNVENFKLKTDRSCKNEDRVAKPGHELGLCLQACPSVRHAETRSVLQNIAQCSHRSEHHIQGSSPRLRSEGFLLPIHFLSQDS